MSVDELYTIYGVNIQDSVAAFIPGIVDQNIDAGIDEIIQSSDGQVDPTFVALMNQNPKIEFTTTAIVTALAAIGISGRAIATGADFWMQKLAEGAVRTIGAYHLKMTMAQGILVPLRLTAAQGQVARLDVQAVPTWNGSNDPLVLNVAASLSGTVGTSELFTLGPVRINSATVEIGGVQDLTIDFGIDLVIQLSDGMYWPTFVAVMNRRPVITWRTTAVSKFNTFGLVGTAQGATDSTIILRKIDENGTRVADATTGHLIFTIDEGLITSRRIPGSQGSPAMLEMQLTPTYDGTNAIIVIGTGVIS